MLTTVLMQRYLTVIVYEYNLNYSLRADFPLAYCLPTLTINSRDG